MIITFGDNSWILKLIKPWRNAYQNLTPSKIESSMTPWTAVTLRTEKILYFGKPPCISSLSETPLRKLIVRYCYEPFPASRSPFSVTQLRDFPSQTLTKLTTEFCNPKKIKQAKFRPIICSNNTKFRKIGRKETSLSLFDKWVKPVRLSIRLLAAEIRN